MEQLIDTVTAVGADNRAVPLFGELLDDVAGIAEEHAGLDEFDGGVEAVAGSFDNADGGGGGRTDVVSFVEIAVEAAVVDGDVNVDNVAILEGSAVRDSVANDFVHACADGFRKVVVVERGGVGLREKDEQG